MDIKAVIFDYGKVICFPQEAGFMEALAELAGLPPRVMDELVWKYRDEYDRGAVSGETYYRNILEEQGLKPDETLIKRLLRIDHDSWKNINPGTVQLMEDVKTAGLKLGILSNMPTDFLAFLRANVPVFRLCDQSVFSCEVGSVKPETKIYETLLSALGDSPEQVAFFDDLPRNVAKAAELGIRAFLWKDPQNARAELRNLGVKV
jgi:putative hydrolase of the HAD superfamily